MLVSMIRMCASCSLSQLAQLTKDKVKLLLIPEMIADHMVTFQYSNIEMMDLKTKCRQNEDFFRVNPSLLKSLLNDANVDNILSCNNVDVAYNYLEEILDGAIKKATSKVKIRRKVNNYWFDFELQKMRNKKERLYNKYIGSPTVLNKKKYIMQRKIVTKSLSYKKEIISPVPN